MAWRFKASKYKNAAPVVPKPDAYVRDIHVGSYQTYGNNITASAKFMAFNWDHTGSSLAVLSLGDFGRKTKQMPLLHGHSDTVTDLEFSPFNDCLLATGSQDCLIKLWNIPEHGLQESMSVPECTFSYKQRRVETLGFHPVADFLIHSSSFTTLTLWDLVAQKEMYSSNDHSEVVQGVSWKRDGTILVTSCKDKQLRLFDPRTSSNCNKVTNSHQSIKDSRVIWLGDSHRILTTGFDAQRLRQVIIRDIRRFNDVQKSLELDCSTGILMPLYDSDTGMLFLAGKGDTTIGYYEITDKEPYLVEGIKHSGEQTKGACLVPKRALNVMQGEVNRIMQLTSTSVIPITYQVPRKSYRDFHPDLFPDTFSCYTDLVASDWMQGKNTPLNKISLDPAKRQNPDEPIVVVKQGLSKLNDDLTNKKAIIAIKRNDVSAQNVNNGKASDNKSLIAELRKLPQAISVPTTKSDCIIRKSDDSVEIDSIKNDFNMEITVSDQKIVDTNCQIIPPKPLPRISKNRTLLSDAHSIDEVTPSKPLVKPRTNSLTTIQCSQLCQSTVTCGYKPRLGPKPFTPPNFNNLDTFDKIFAVPTAPISNGTHEKNIPSSKKIHTDEQVVDKSNNDEKNCKQNGTLHNTNVEIQIPEDSVSVVEKLENEDGFADTVDQAILNRSDVQRQSIAERRKMYENRSQSLQETNSNGDGKSSPIGQRREFGKNTKNDHHILSDKESALIDINKVEVKCSTPTPKRTSTVFGRVSKFRHLKGTIAHKSKHIENIRNVSRQVPGECDGFHANPKRVAVPLGGPGGKIAVFELKNFGRLPDGVIPTLVNGCSIMDFMWNPFDNCQLAVACDDGIVKIWSIPETGLKQPTNQTQLEFNAHSDKIYFLKYHPLAKDVLATGSHDRTIKIWDLSEIQVKITIHGHSEQIFSFGWSQCGSYCATVSKDTKIRVYRPLVSPLPIKEGKGPVGTRGARIVWALHGNFIIVIGFDKVSERQIMVFNSNNLEQPLNTIGLDVSPAILIPYYDDDSSTLFLTGKGDTTIYAFEITSESPYICPLSHQRYTNLHQGLSFLPKNACDVGNVEFAKGYRLTNNTIEPLSFTVPRIKTELFQDDLFPPTCNLWTPTMTSHEWFAGEFKKPQLICLKPKGMENLSQYQGSAGVIERSINKSASTPFIGGFKNDRNNGDTSVMKNKQAQLQNSVSKKLEVNLKLEQDEMEGVDECEWDD